MNPGAGVTSLPVLHDWYASLAEFRTEAGDALTSLALSLQQAAAWLDLAIEALVIGGFVLALSWIVFAVLVIVWRVTLGALWSATQHALEERRRRTGSGRGAPSGRAGKRAGPGTE